VFVSVVDDFLLQEKQLSELTRDRDRLQSEHSVDKEELVSKFTTERDRLSAEIATALRDRDDKLVRAERDKQQVRWRFGVYGKHTPFPNFWPPTLLPDRFFCCPTQCVGATFDMATCLCVSVCLSRLCIVPRRRSRSSCDLHEIVAQPF